MWFLKWIMSIFGALLYKRHEARAIHSVAATIVGLKHISMTRESEDRYGIVELKDKKIFFVIDGAGGEDNGKDAAIYILRKLQEILPKFLASWSNRQEILVDLPAIFQEANSAAFQARGKATLILYVQLPNGHWALLQVGDAVFVGKDTKGIWQLPIKPQKYCWPGYTSRNNTELLGVAGIKPRYASGDSAFLAFLLASDWVCGNGQNAILLDTSPHGCIGTYAPNQNVLNNFATLLIRGGRLIEAQAAQDLLLSIQNNQVPEVLVSDDDITVIYGTID